MTPDERELAELIVATLNLEMSAGDIAPEAPLYREGLGLDSIDILEIAMAVSQTYGFQFHFEVTKADAVNFPRDCWSSMERHYGEMAELVAADSVRSVEAHFAEGADFSRRITSRWPIVVQCFSHSSPTEANSPARTREYSRSNSRRIVVANSARETGFPNSIFKEVACAFSSLGKSLKFKLTSTPMPTSTYLIRSNSALSSVRMPATFLPDSGDLIASSCEDLVPVCLVSYVPNHLVFGSIENIVQRHRELDSTQAGRKMPACLRDGVNHEAAQLICELS
jgi:acyl carrier protein